MSSRTTGLYDRRGDEISLDEIERVGIRFDQQLESCRAGLRLRETNGKLNENVSGS